MNNLSKEREESIAIARELYIATGEEANISVAYVRYLKEFPVENYPAKITTKDEYFNIPKVIVDENRPKCPDCNKPLQVWEVNNHPKSMVGGEFKTQWVCMDEATCGYQGEYSLLTLQEQVKKYDKPST